MTRVIAGTAGGRRLAVPPGTGTRPTSDRAREGLFSTWQSLLGGPLDGERVLDLYAGSGAVGLEALSRGAGHTLLVEADAKAVRTVRENVKNLGLPGADVRSGKAEQIIRATPLKVLAVIEDEEIIAEAREEAAAVVAADPELTHLPALRTALDALLDEEREQYLEKG